MPIERETGSLSLLNISGKPSATTSKARTLKKWSFKWRKMFESNSNNFLDTLFKKTHPILPVSFIWKKNRKTGTLGQMLKKGHKISKALTITQLFGWIWEGAMFKCLRRAY